MLIPHVRTVGRNWQAHTTIFRFDPDAVSKALVGGQIPRGEEKEEGEEEGGGGEGGGEGEEGGREGEEGSER